LWFDDPSSEVYMPHLTLMNIDPKADKQLMKQINERRRDGKKGRDKAGKKGARRKEQSQEPYGWSRSLMRDVRKAFAKVSFGTQMVTHAELQSGFECVQRVYLTPHKAGA